MPTTAFVSLIQSAELGAHTVQPTIDPRFVPAVRSSLRRLSARWLRAGANGGLKLAQRLDPRTA